MTAEKWEKELVGPVCRRRELRIELHLLKIPTDRICSLKVREYLILALKL